MDQFQTRGKKNFGYKLLSVSLLLLKSVVVNYEVTYQTQHIHADEGTKHKILDFESFGSVQEI